MTEEELIKLQEQAVKETNKHVNLLAALDELCDLVEKIEFAFKALSNDVAANVAYKIKQDANDPEFISQNKAFQMFGRGNVERWRKQGKVIAYKRPGKVEYRTADLRLLQRTQQDYLEK